MEKQKKRDAREQANRERAARKSAAPADPVSKRRNEQAAKAQQQSMRAKQQELDRLALAPAPKTAAASILELEGASDHRVLNDMDAMRAKQQELAILTLCDEMQGPAGTEGQDAATALPPELVATVEKLGSTLHMEAAEAAQDLAVLLKHVFWSFDSDSNGTLEAEEWWEFMADAGKSKGIRSKLADATAIHEWICGEAGGSMSVEALLHALAWVGGDRAEAFVAYSAAAEASGSAAPSAGGGAKAVALGGSGDGGELEDLDLNDPELAASAAKIQSRFRGKKGRAKAAETKSVGAMFKFAAEEEKWSALKALLEKEAAAEATELPALLKHVFWSYDADNNGRLDKSEWRVFVNELGAPHRLRFSAAEADRLHAQICASGGSCDAEGGGDISQGQLEAAMAALEARDGASMALNVDVASSKVSGPAGTEGQDAATALPPELVATVEKLGSTLHMEAAEAAQDLAVLLKHVFWSFDSDSNGTLEAEEWWEFMADAGKSKGIRSKLADATAIHEWICGEAGGSMSVEALLHALAWVGGDRAEAFVAYSAAAEASGSAAPSAGGGAKAVTLGGGGDGGELEDLDLNDPELAASAAKIQSRFRGKKGRAKAAETKSVGAMFKFAAEEEKWSALKALLEKEAAAEATELPALLKHVFWSYDADNNGRLDKSEWRVFVNELGAPHRLRFSAAEADRLHAHICASGGSCDAEGGGDISQGQLETAMAALEARDGASMALNSNS
eukprot:SAG11_NODE_323_length_10745_cov_18.203926_4_plen_736_part_00